MNEKINIYFLFIILDCQSSVENCYNYGKIGGTSNVAGIVGQFTFGGAQQITINVNNCYNYGAIASTSGYSGGIVGATGAEWTTKDNYKVVISNCVNNGEVSSGGRVAGILGYFNNITTGEIDNCVNNGKVTGTSNVGGITGGPTKATISGQITNCINNGVITGTSATGGIGGTFYGNYANCVNNGTPNVLFGAGTYSLIQE